MEKPTIPDPETSETTPVIEDEKWMEYVRSLLDDAYAKLAQERHWQPSTQKQMRHYYEQFAAVLMGVADDLYDAGWENGWASVFWELVQADRGTNEAFWDWPDVPTYTRDRSTSETLEGVGK